MSEAEDLIHASLRAFNEGDWHTLEQMWDPQGTITSPEDWPEAGVRHGWTSVREQFEVLKADWKEDRAEVVSIEETRPGTLLVGFRWTVIGAASGVPLEVPIWMVAAIHDGKFVRADYFQEEGPARACAEGGG